MESIKSIAAAGLAMAAGGNQFPVGPVPGEGHHRAFNRLIDQLTWWASKKADWPATEPSRQVRRAAERRHQSQVEAAARKAAIAGRRKRKAAA